MERPTYASEEELVILGALQGRLDRIEQAVSDHDQRFDTLQTELPMRVWFWLQGWPWIDLNAPRRQRRPWRRGSWRWRRR